MLTILQFLGYTLFIYCLLGVLFWIGLMFSFKPEHRKIMDTVFIGIQQQLGRLKYLVYLALLLTWFPLFIKLVQLATRGSK